MAKQKANSDWEQQKRSGGRTKRDPHAPSPLWPAILKRDCLSDELDDIHNKMMNRQIELEAALDFYGYGPAAKGLEPMRGEEYAKAMAADGGKIARAYLKDRLDPAYYGVPKKGAPGGWGSGP